MNWIMLVIAFILGAISMFMLVCIGYAAKQEELAYKIEPRFKVGDWVVFIKSKSVYQVEKIENYEYTLRHILGGSLCLSFSNEELIRKWTIQDAKDGDILCCESGWMCIFQVTK